MKIPGLRCPNCGNQAMPLRTKAFLGPGRSVTCDHCGAQVGVVGSSAFIATMPVFILLIAGTVLGVENTLLLVLIGAAFAIPAQILLVPLERRDDVN